MNCRQHGFGGTAAFLDQIRHGPCVKQANAAIKRWMGEEPNSNTAQYQMGRLAALSGLYLVEGEAALRKYLAMPRGKDDQEPKNARYRLGQVLIHADRKDEAKVELQAALKLDPKFKDARDALAAL